MATWLTFWFLLPMITPATAEIKTGGDFSTDGHLQHLLGRHNLYRCMHGVPLFTWDTNIQEKAQAYVNTGSTKNMIGHSTWDDRKHNGESWGENIAWSMGTPLPETTPVSSWYSEIKCYPGKDSSKTPNPGCTIGHFTQAVWKDSQRLGCGYKFDDTDKTVNVVCQYAPAGNVGGKTGGQDNYKLNVLRATKTESECKAVAEASVALLFNCACGKGLGTFFMVLLTLLLASLL